MDRVVDFGEAQGRASRIAKIHYPVDNFLTDNLGLYDIIKRLKVSRRFAQIKVSGLVINYY